MNKKTGRTSTEPHASRRELLVGAGHLVMFGAASAVLGGCGRAESPADGSMSNTEVEIGAQCVTVLYPNGDDVTFDFDYYRDHHLTLIMDLYGDSIRRFELRRGLPNPDGSAPTYVATITIWIADVEAFAAAGEKHTQTLVDDVPNFTNTMPVFQNEELYGLGTT